MPIFSRRKKSKKKSCSFCRVPFDKPAIKNFSNCPFGKKQKKREKTAGPRIFFSSKRRGSKSCGIISWKEFVERNWSWFFSGLVKVTYILLDSSWQKEILAKDAKIAVGGSDFFFDLPSFFYSYRSESWEIGLRVKIVWKTQSKLKNSVSPGIQKIHE